MDATVEMAPAKVGRPKKPPVQVQPDRYVRIALFSAITGYSEAAVRGKIAEGVWRQGVHFLKPEDGNILIDREAYHAWCRGEKITQEK